MKLVVAAKPSALVGLRSPCVWRLWSEAVPAVCCIRRVSQEDNMYYHRKWTACPPPSTHPLNWLSFALILLRQQLSTAVRLRLSFLPVWSSSCGCSVVAGSCHHPLESHGNVVGCRDCVVLHCKVSVMQPCIIIFRPPPSALIYNIRPRPWGRRQRCVPQPLSVPDNNPSSHLIVDYTPGEL